MSLSSGAAEEEDNGLDGALTVVLDESSGTSSLLIAGVCVDSGRALVGLLVDLLARTDRSRTGRSREGTGFMLRTLPVGAPRFVDLLCMLQTVSREEEVICLLNSNPLP